MTVLKDNPMTSYITLDTKLAAVPNERKQKNHSRLDRALQKQRIVFQFVNAAPRSYYVQWKVFFYPGLDNAIRFIRTRFVIGSDMTTFSQV